MMMQWTEQIYQPTICEEKEINIQNGYLYFYDVLYIVYLISDKNEHKTKGQIGQCSRKILLK